MRYRVKIRRYETVIRDAVIEVEAGGKRQAEQVARVQAQVFPELEWGPPSSGHDLKFDAAEAEPAPAPAKQPQSKPRRNFKPRHAFLKAVADSLRAAKFDNVKTYRDGSLTVTEDMRGTTVFSFYGYIEHGEVPRYVCRGYDITAAKQRWLVKMTETSDVQVVANRILQDLAK